MTPIETQSLQSIIEAGWERREALQPASAGQDELRKALEFVIAALDDERRAEVRKKGRPAVAESGGSHVDEEITADEARRLYYTPGFLASDRISEVAAGIERLVPAPTP